MGSLDIAAKVLLAEAALDFLRLALGPLKVRDVGREDTEIPSTGYRTDRLLRYKLADEIEERFLHVEVEANWASDVPARAFAHFAMLQTKLARLSTLVICLKPGDRQGAPRAAHVVEGPRGEEVVRFGYSLVLAWAPTVEDVLGGPRGLIPLVPYAAGARPEHVERAFRELAREPEASIGRTELPVVLATFAGNVFPDVSWMRFIPPEVRMESTAYQEILAEGRAEGRVEGRVEALRETAGLFLRGRLGSSGEALVARLANAPESSVVSVLALFVKNLDEATLREQLERILPRAE